MADLTIWKFPVAIADSFEIVAPPMVKVLSVQVQGGAPFMWAIVRPGEREVRHRFHVRGTGQPLTGEENELVGTFQMHGGALVFHLFMEVTRG